jgi:hypothetical protein
MKQECELANRDSVACCSAGIMIQQIESISMKNW